MKSSFKSVGDLVSAMAVRRLSFIVKIPNTFSLFLALSIVTQAEDIVRWLLEIALILQDSIGVDLENLRAKFAWRTTQSSEEEASLMLRLKPTSLVRVSCAATYRRVGGLRCGRDERIR